jgi:hypothetical protein
MYCNRCGATLEQGQNFCSACGCAVGAVPMLPVESRLSGHMRLLAIFWFALSAFRLIPGLFLIVMFGAARGFFPPDLPFFVPPMLQTLGYLITVGAVLGLVAAWGLWERRPWARMLAIVLGCLSLLDMPFGTALGIYTLWVLLPARSEEEYRRLAREA